MKTVSLYALAAVAVTAAACSTEVDNASLSSSPVQQTKVADENALFSLTGYPADEMYDAMWAGDNDGVKSVSGKGSIYCKLNVPTFPEGAQGIVAPSANCTGYPHVDFPDGAQGIVAPWFNLNGSAGYWLWESLAVEANKEHAKEVTGTFTITCTSGDPSTCTGTQESSYDDGDDDDSKEPWAVLEGYAAGQLFDALWAEEIDGVKTVSGKASLYCRAIVPNIPDGAQGIFMPVANCRAYPLVDFPEGAQGIVAPWFTLNGFAGNALWDALPLTADADNAKEYTGNLSISCTSERCTFVK